MTVKLKLREIREYRGLSQIELAEMMGIKPQTLSRLEVKAAKGELRNVSLDTLDRLCEALGVLPYELLEYRPNFRKQIKQIS
ncbi:MAG: helix-turn-helix domain-containing protein [Cyanobacteria bacterium]|jgi:putative transcriptional regulator|nr:helix-turn-helix domain-containing protein [Cyanobacteria bacterium GSL.Bin1]